MKQKRIYISIGKIVSTFKSCPSFQVKERADIFELAGGVDGVNSILSIRRLLIRSLHKFALSKHDYRAITRRQVNLFTVLLVRCPPRKRRFSRLELGNVLRPLLHVWSRVPWTRDDTLCALGLSIETLY